MALFAYRAVDAEGRVSTGNLDASNAIDLELRLKRLGLDLLTFEGVKRSTAARTRNVTRTELITFCFHLSQLLKAGVNIIEALTDLRDTVENAGFRQVIASLLEDIEGGLKLSEAMANHSVLLRQRVRRPRAGRRAERADGRGAGRAHREPQVAGRDGEPGQARHGLSGHRHWW
jgi:type IV pilus assembly protein PilC